LLEYIGDEELIAKELMDKDGLKHRPSFKDNYFLPILKDG
jgi:hypothetical protein